MNKEAKTIVSPEHTAGNERLEPSEIVSWVADKGVDLDNPELIASQVAVLMSEFDIEESVFQEGRNRLLITAIANELGDAEFGSDHEQSQRISSMIMLSFGRNTRFRDELEKNSYKPGFSEERTQAAYDKFKNEALSAKMKEFIQKDNDLIKVRQRLGVDDGSEAPFDVRVIDTDNSRGRYDLAPIDWENLSYEEGSAQHERNLAKQMELEENEKYLLSEKGSEDGEIPIAWVDTLKDGRVILNVPVPLAESILYPHEERSEYYSEDRYEENKAILIHEYVHTQKSVLRNGRVGLGIAIEELRAEYFSGDLTGGYLEIKKYFNNINILTGYTPEKSLESYDVFDSEEYELDIARALGLEGYLDAMTVIPDVYANRSTANEFLKEMVQIDGGIDGHFDKMYDWACQQRGEEKVLSRISQYVDGVVEILKSNGDEELNDDEELTNIMEFVMSYGQVSRFTELAMADFKARYILS